MLESSSLRTCLLVTTGVSTMLGLGALSSVNLMRTASSEGSSGPSVPVPLGTSRPGTLSAASSEGSSKTSPAPLGASRRNWGPDSLLGDSSRNGAMSGRQASRRQ